MSSAPRHIAFVAFPRLTMLDLIGVYDPLRRVKTMGIDPGLRHEIIGTADELRDDSGLRFHPDRVLGALTDVDLLIVPGGYGTRPLQDDADFLAWLRSYGDDRPIASVCTGALLLGKAGFLAGKRATTHHSAFADLAPLCGEVVHERVVDEGRVVTAGGVLSALELGLHLVARFWGEPARSRIATQMEYLQK